MTRGTASQASAQASKLLVTGMTLATHFEPAVSAYSARISTVGWLCGVGDKTYAALVEAPKSSAGNALERIRPHWNREGFRRGGLM